jgi:hypothetical protein
MKIDIILFLDILIVPLASFRSKHTQNHVCHISDENPVTSLL